MGALAKARITVEKQTPPPTPRCSLGRAWATLDKADRAELVAWLRDPQLTSVAIAGFLSAAGLRVSDQMIARHRPHYPAGAACRCAVAVEARR